MEFSASLDEIAAAAIEKSVSRGEAREWHYGIGNLTPLRTDCPRLCVRVREESFAGGPSGFGSKA